MATSWVSAVALALACAVLCPAAIAADEETRRTGTIEVEVVYKDTSEPLEGTCVTVYTAKELESLGQWGFPKACAVARLPSSGRIVLGALAFDTYRVMISPDADLDSGGLGSFSDQALRFCPSLSECDRQITLSADCPTAELRFAVERGCTIEGTVRQADGSPVTDAHVVAHWEVSRQAYSSSCWINSEGRYELSGLDPGRSVELRVVGPYQVSGSASEAYSSGEFWRQDVLLTEERSRVDVHLDTASLEVAVDVLMPLWPFSKAGASSVEAVGFHVGEQPDEPSLVPYYVRLRAPERSSSRILPKNRYVFTLTGLPRGKPIALAVGARVPPETGFSHISWGASRRVVLRDDKQVVRLTVYEPGARRSYSFWYAVVFVIVLAVFGTILVKQMRKRRAKETAT